MKRLLTVVLCMLSGAAQAAPTEQSAPVEQAAPIEQAAPHALSFREFMQRVQQSNFDLRAQRHAIAAARAQESTARIVPDPVLTGGIAQIDVSGQAAPFMSTLGLTLPVELGGKRAARVAAAERESAVAESEFDETLRRVRAEAATAFVDAVAARQVLERKRLTLQSLERLVAVNEKRQQTGDIGEVALMQSRVESQRYRGEVLAAEGELVAQEQALRQFLGDSDDARSPVDHPLAISATLPTAPRDFQDDALLQQAQHSRADVRVRWQELEAAGARIGLARRNRWIDLSLNVSWQRSLYSEPFASPQFDALGATVSLPLPFSRVHRGDLDAAIASQAQFRVRLQAAVLRAEVDVQRALTRYRASVKQLALYNQGLLADAERVHAATLYSYQRGGATLLEVLNAQRTVEEVHLSYAAAVAEHARQLIAVEQAAGIWDIDF